MKPDQERKVSLFHAQKEKSEYILEDDSLNATPRKKHTALLVILSILAFLMVALCVVMTLNLFNMKEMVLGWIHDHSEAEQSLADESVNAVSIVEVSEIESSVEPVSAASTEISEESDAEPSHGWVINQMGYTYLYNGVGIEQFNFNDATISKYLNIIDVLNQSIKTTSRVYCMPIPTRIGYMQNEIPLEIRREDNFYNSSQKDFLDAVQASLPERVKLINLYDAFSKAYEEGNDPYFKSDKNWTSDAAYLAYTAYCETRKFSPVSLDKYNKTVKEGFLGSFYFATNSTMMGEQPEQFIYYQNDYTANCVNTVFQNGLTFKNYCLADNKINGTADLYYVYLGTSKAHFKITTKAGTGNKLLIIGDQSAAAMIPFLANHFNEIHYYDVYNGTEEIETILKETRFNDILLCTYMTNAVKGEYPDNLAKMLGINNQNNE